VTGTIAPIGVGTAVLHSKQATAGAPLNPFVDPGNTNAPIIFEPTAGLTGGAVEVWVIASGGVSWGGCQVWVSTDGSTYALAGTIYKGGRQGVLTASLPAAADPDTTDTLAVDLTQSGGQLLSGTQADADAYVTLCYCDAELVSFETATSPRSTNTISPISGAAHTAPRSARMVMAPSSLASGPTTRRCSAMPTRRASSATRSS
jgi:hypothetical protein